MLTSFFFFSLLLRRGKSDLKKGDYGGGLGCTKRGTHEVKQAVAMVRQSERGEKEKRSFGTFCSKPPPPRRGHVGCGSGGAEGVVCWWNMKCGRVLGVHEGMVVEYDASTLAPLGLVIAKDELAGRKVAVVDSGLEAECEVSEVEGMEGKDCVDVDKAEQVRTLLVKTRSWGLGEVCHSRHGRV